MLFVSITFAQEDVIEDYNDSDYYGEEYYYQEYNEDDLGTVNVKKFQTKFFGHPWYLQ